ncbi:unnamed protein product [Sphagnum troendelagicum]|uniref:Uncharacterized protein n=1 Tax=Sphagnum troendelagicum TaxID=128251 RepID=A0ABP0TUR3_9BRYO
MEAVMVKHQRELEAAATREEQLHENDLKGQLEELRSHHTTTLGQLMETVTTGTAVCFCACNSTVRTTPSHLYIFQGTTSLEVNSCLPLWLILCAHECLLSHCLFVCLLFPNWAWHFTPQGPWPAFEKTYYCAVTD